MCILSWKGLFDAFPVILVFAVLDITLKVVCYLFSVNLNYLWNGALQKRGNSVFIAGKQFCSISEHSDYAFSQSKCK